MIDPVSIRVPLDLAVGPLPVPRRLLIVGSCLTEVWAQRMERLSPACESDLYWNVSKLPEAPPRPVEDYDLQIVQLPLRNVLADGWFARLSETDVAGHEALFERACDRMRQALRSAMSWNEAHGLLTFVFPFLPPQQNPAGRLLPRYDLRNAVYFVEKLNETLARELAGYVNTYFFDFNEVVATFGRRYVNEDAFTAFNHGGFLGPRDYHHDLSRFDPVDVVTDLVELKIDEIVAASWREMLAMYRTIRQVDAVKMVVIDLDDTLWRGIIAEQEPEELPTTEGWPKAFWETLLFLKRRGVLLAIISKNDESRVAGVWNRIFGKTLLLDDFAIHRINFQPKAANMAEILRSVNLLPGNVVYIDDNPTERAAIKASYPEMRVLGGNPLLWRRVLLWSAETQVAGVTAESAARTAMVRAQVVREEVRQVLSREEFLASLNVKVTVFRVDSTRHPRFARAMELINKTNQFNTTGRRWTREECEEAFASGTEFFAFEVADAFTEYGLVGVVVVTEATIVQFVMSCRVMGLDVEVAAVAKVIGMLRAPESGDVRAVVVNTERNLPCRDVFARLGFESVSEGNWRRARDLPLSLPPHVTLVGESVGLG